VNRVIDNARGLQPGWQERVALAITAAISLALSTGMIAALLYLLIALGSLISSPTAYAQAAPPAAGVQLQAGIEKENVDGDLNAAISIYQKIASNATAPREVRAKALLRLAGCEEKLGKQAKQVYEQIVREYSDQPAAAQARTRLAAIKQQDHPSAPATMTARKIEWAKLGYVTAHDTDGERATFLGQDGNLFFGDLAGRNRHLVYRAEEPKAALGSDWFASRDFSMVALHLPATATHPTIVAVVKMDGTGYRELIRDDMGKLFGSIVSTFDIGWSWDNRYLVVASTPFLTAPTKEEGQLVVVDVSNGSHRELVRADSDWLSAARFSPDNRFIAYEATPAKPDSGTNRIYVLPVGGGEPHLAQEGPQRERGEFYLFKDWTADGRFLVTKEMRQGRSALYLLPMRNGAPAGTSEFVRFGEFDDAHTSLSGTLVYQDHAATSTDVDAFLGSFDSKGQIESWRSLDIRGGLNDGGYPWPSFSPDGSRIAYRARGADPNQTNLIVQDLSTGRERVLYQSSNGRLACRYSNKEPKLFCTLTGRNAGNKTDLFTVDEKTGEVEKIASLQGSRCIFNYPDDGKVFYFVDLSDATWFQLTRWDLDTQQETLVVPGPQEVHSFEAPSLDGHLLFRIAQGDSLSVRSMPDGDWKTLVSGDKGLFAGGDTTHDGNWTFYSTYDSTGKPGLFRIPTTGGAAERVGDLPIASFQGKFDLSADGSQIIATSFNHQKFDLWVLENFEPAAKK
jgi:Tol biopolymer transport system component